MSPQSFSDVEHSLRMRTTEKFLAIMDEIIPWDKWANLIEPHCFSGKRGHPPKGIEKMLGGRMYLLQCRFKLSVEGANYDSFAFRYFMGINFPDEPIPAATALLHFQRKV